MLALHASTDLYPRRNHGPAQCSEVGPLLSEVDRVAGEHAEQLVNRPRRQVPPAGGVHAERVDLVGIVVVEQEVAEQLEHGPLLQRTAPPTILTAVAELHLHLDQQSADDEVGVCAAHIEAARIR